METTPRTTTEDTLYRTFVFSTEEPIPRPRKDYSSRTASHCGVSLSNVWISPGNKFGNYGRSWRDPLVKQENEGTYLEAVTPARFRTFCPRCDDPFEFQVLRVALAEDDCGSVFFLELPGVHLCSRFFVVQERKRCRVIGKKSSTARDHVCDQSKVTAGVGESLQCQKFLCPSLLCTSKAISVTV